MGHVHTHTHTLIFHTHFSLHSYCLCVLLQYSLPLDLISREAFSQWMEIVRAVADRPVPEQTNAVDEEDRVDLPWWKCKKWALHILHRMFERSEGTHMKGEDQIVCVQETLSNSRLKKNVKWLLVCTDLFMLGWFIWAGAAVDCVLDRMEGRISVGAPQNEPTWETQW